jgi:hypothetical protein
MKFKEITLADVSTEAKVETLGIVLDKELESLYGVVNSVEAMKGDKGDKGEQGIPGKDGKDGKPGVDGKSGVNGRDGKDGVGGKDGEAGLAAPKIIDAEVALDDTLLLTLSDGTEIKTTKTIVGQRGAGGSNGANGSKGDKGDAGVGIAVGGTTGQVLTKVSNTDYDTTWTTNGAGTVTSVGGTGTVNGLSLSGTVTSTGNLTLGGTLDLSAPPAIGATTPSTVNATTITGQTGVLKGTGNNLLLQSQTFTNASWTKQAATATASGVTAPDGTSTGQTLTESDTTAEHRMYQSLTVSVGSNYTWSIYAKPNGRNFIRIASASATRCANFNISTGTVGTVSSGTTATITDAGNGWYRCSMTAASTVSPEFVTINLADADAGTGNSYSYAGNGTSGVFFWGSQIEIGNTLNTYIPTTTTAVYGTPTLSFSGVSTIGLESNGALFVQPAGTGALQAQATTSTTAGGNARGANAVDWQTTRNNAAQVASGSQSIVGGGGNNRATSTYATASGGNNNTSSGFGSVIAGGNTNTSSGSYSFVGAGESNTASQYSTAVVGGRSNTAAGYLNFIGGGFTNAGTSGSAVTTQSGTMNATTAVTLSGSNANIKVGQLITGTSINTSPNTYVAAISGTSLTLSQAASGSSTSTLSFFTPHGVVVGGGNNQATGSYSFIGGGGDAGTAANRNSAAGDWSSVVGGIKNTIASTSPYSVIAGGFNSSITGNGYSFLGSGILHSISNDYTSVVGGYSNTASGRFSFVAGGGYGTTRAISGNHVFPACFVPIAFASGVSQSALLILARETTDATATALTSTSAAASTINQVILPNNSAYFFRGEVISGKTAGGDTKGWTIEGVIKRGANAAATTLVGVTVLSTHADAGAATWAIAVTADTTNGGIRVTFTGQAATTIRTVCQIRTTEMTF